MVSRGEWWWLSVEMHGLGGGAYQIVQQAWHGKSPCTQSLYNTCMYSSILYCVCFIPFSKLVFSLPSPGGVV